MFSGQSTVLRIGMLPETYFKVNEMAMFFVNWVFFTYVTSGGAFPCGIFLPGMIVGVALGQLYNPVHALIFPGCTNGECMPAEVMSLLGAAAVLSGSTRMTFCLAVIMLETSCNTELFLPIIITLYASYWTAKVLQPRSIYEFALLGKGIPILLEEAPECNREIPAYRFMASPVVSMNSIIKVQEAYDKIKDNTYNGFPVVNGRGEPIGIIERDVLITIIQQKAWY
jgi:Voltage gated chloride channel/CBS domain